jgi:hypothetical protein
MQKFMPAKKITRFSALLAAAMLILICAIGFSSCDNPDETNIHAADSSVKAAADTIRAAAEPVIRKIDSTIKDNVDTVTAKIKTAGKDLKEKIKK